MCVLCFSNLWCLAEIWNNLTCLIFTCINNQSCGSLWVQTWNLTPIHLWGLRLNLTWSHLLWAGPGLQHGGFETQGTQTWGLLIQLQSWHKDHLTVTLKFYSILQGHCAATGTAHTQTVATETEAQNHSLCCRLITIKTLWGGLGWGVSSVGTPGTRHAEAIVLTAAPLIRFHWGSFAACCLPVSCLFMAALSIKAWRPRKCIRAGVSLHMFSLISFPDRFNKGHGWWKTLKYRFHLIKLNLIL